MCKGGVIAVKASASGLGGVPSPHHLGRLRPQPMRSFSRRLPDTALKGFGHRSCFCWQAQGLWQRAFDARVVRLGQHEHTHSTSRLPQKTIKLMWIPSVPAILMISCRHMQDAFRPDSGKQDCCHVTDRHVACLEMFSFCFGCGPQWDSHPGGWLLSPAGPATD